MKRTTQFFLASLLIMFVVALTQCAELRPVQKLPAGGAYLEKRYGVEAFSLWSQPYLAERITSEVVTVADMPFTNALRITIRPEKGQENAKRKIPKDDAAIRITSLRGMKKGDSMLLRVYLRAGDSMSFDEEAYAHFTLWAKPKPRGKVSLDKTFLVGKKWRRIEIPFTVENDVDSSGMYLKVSVGDQPQELLFGGFEILNYEDSIEVAKLPLSLPGLVDESMGISGFLIDTKFADADVPILDKKGKPYPRIKGVLPEGWFDNSSWAQIWAEYKLDNDEGLGYLRVDVTDRASGNAGGQLQMRYPLEGKLQEGSFFNVKLKGRSVDGQTIQLLIRETGGKYRRLWSKDVGLKRGWFDYAFTFYLEDIPDNFEGVGFFIFFISKRVGSVDLVSLSLEQKSKKALESEIRKRFGGEIPDNILRISRYPLGPQSGHVLGKRGSDKYDISITADKDVIGVSKSPALHIETYDRDLYYKTVAGKRTNYEYTFEPFDTPLMFEKHVASMYIKGTWHGEIHVKAADQYKDAPLTNVAVSVNSPDKFVRVQLPFQPIPMARCHVLTLAGVGNCWIDGVMVSMGTNAPPYSSQKKTEVALALPKSDASVARIQFDDEKAEVRYAVTGKPDGAKLHVNVVNVYGEGKQLKPIRLGNAFLNEGTFSYDVFPAGRKHGTFRIEAWTEKDGKRISPPNEVVIHRLRRPRYWGRQAPNSPFGIHVQPRHMSMVMAKAMGMNWVRLHGPDPAAAWKYLEPNDDEWHWQDETIDRYIEYGFEIFSLFSTAPPWASTMDKPRNGFFDAFWTPKRDALEDWDEYVRLYTERYKGKIKYYEFWNEPYGGGFWHDSYDTGPPKRPMHRRYVHASPDYFAELQARTYRVMKEANEDAELIGFCSVVREDVGDVWTRALVPLGATETCDIISYHAYQNPPGGGTNDETTKGLRIAMAGFYDKFNKVPKPIWMSEGNGARTYLANGIYNHTLPYDDEENVIGNADLEARYNIAMLGLNVKRFFIYSVSIYGGFTRRDTWKALITDDGYMHPSGAAISAQAWLLEDKPFVKIVPLASDVFAYIFEGKNETVAALLTTSAEAEYTLPRGATIYDIFGNTLDAGSRLPTTATYVTIKGTAKDMEELLR